MRHFNEWRGVYNQFLMLTQFGLSVSMPLLLCILLCWWLTDRFSFGLWVYIPGFILGLGASFMTAYKFYLAIAKKDDTKKEKKRYNRHR